MQSYEISVIIFSLAFMAVLIGIFTIFNAFTRKGSQELKDISLIKDNNPDKVDLKVDPIPENTPKEKVPLTGANDHEHKGKDGQKNTKENFLEFNLWKFSSIAILIIGGYILSTQQSKYRYIQFYSDYSEELIREFNE